ncbi:MAG: ribokinase [Actinophytocola sp.]|nr:ribokinase [Actinophytocola sp.]
MADEVVVLGQVARDLVLRVAEVPGPHGSAAVRTRREMLGGKGANQAVALRQLGVPVSLVGVVGNDSVGARLLEQARTDRIDVSHVVSREGAQTALIADIVDDTHQWRYLEHIPTDVLLTEGDVFAASTLLKRAKWVLCQLQQPLEAMLLATRLARDTGARVILDGAPSGSEADIAEVLSRAHVIRANEHEAELLTGRPITDVTTAADAASRLLDYGPTLVLLAVSGAGNLFVSRTGRQLFPLLEVDVADTTGAGDALIGTFTAALAHGEGTRRAAAFAVAAAANSAGRLGGRPVLRWRDLATDADTLAP